MVLVQLLHDDKLETLSLLSFRVTRRPETGRLFSFNFMPFIVGSDNVACKNILARRWFRHETNLRPILGRPRSLPRPTWCPTRRMHRPADALALPRSGWIKRLVTVQQKLQSWSTASPGWQRSPGIGGFVFT